MSAQNSDLDTCTQQIHSQISPKVTNCNVFKNTFPNNFSQIMCHTKTNKSNILKGGGADGEGEAGCGGVGLSEGCVG